MGAAARDARDTERVGGGGGGEGIEGEGLGEMLVARGARPELAIGASAPAPRPHLPPLLLLLPLIVMIVVFVGGSRLLYGRVHGDSRVSTEILGEEPLQGLRGDETVRSIEQGPSSPTAARGSDPANRFIRAVRSISKLF